MDEGGLAADPQGWRSGHRRDHGGTAADTSIAHEAEIVEEVVRKASGPVHLVGHSFGGLVSLAVALHGRVSLSSLAIAEAPVGELLRECKEDLHYRSFKAMTESYFAAFETRDKEAIAAMIDFYGGPGTFASREIADHVDLAETRAN